MSYLLDIKESAEIGALEAFHYYESQQQGLGDRFLDNLEVQLDVIKKNPLLFQKKYKDFRQALIKDYPYHIIYEVENTTVVVYKIIYGGRNPKTRYKKR